LPDSLVVQQPEAWQRPYEGGGGVHLFPDFECNDTFLEVINFTAGCEPREGLYKNFVCYSTIGLAQRWDYQQQADTTVNKAGPDASADDISISTGIDNIVCDGNIGTDLALIIAEADSACTGPKRKLNWKTE
jgi:hypothetical protein